MSPGSAEMAREAKLIIFTYCNCPIGRRVQDLKEVGATQDKPLAAGYSRPAATAVGDAAMPFYFFTYRFIHISPSTLCIAPSCSLALSLYTYRCISLYIYMYVSPHLSLYIYISIHTSFSLYISLYISLSLSIYLSIALSIDLSFSIALSLCI